MVKKVLDYIKRYHMIEQDDTIVAGISGGADSVCLLFVLCEIQKHIPFDLEVVHINHGIRPEAVEDADYVGELCRQMGIPFHLVTENVKERAKEHGVSEEEEGRQIRYQAFGRVLGERKGRIAVAHNSNDRAETMLFHLFRGTGLTGASGIRPVNGKVIRPLLCLQRSEIEAWLWAKGIPFCNDSTNEEDIYTRNRIRHHILTYAERQVCQGAVANMNQAAEQLQSAGEYIERQTRLAMARCVQEADGQGKIVIKIPEFFREDEYLRGCILMECIGKAAGGRKDITSAHIKNTESLFKGTGSRELHLPYGLRVYKKYDLGMIQKKDHSEQNREAYEVTFPSSLKVPGLGVVEFTINSYNISQIIPEKTYTKWFDYDKITSVVMLRTRKPGDYLTINRQMAHKSLQDYFVNEKVPKNERDKIYFLAEGSHVIWIPGYRISEYYKVHENTRTVLQVSIWRT